MVLSVGVISAACDSDAISIITPTADSYTKEDTQLINWSLTSDCNAYDFRLKYIVGSCTGTESFIVDKLFASGETDYTWDISNLEEEDYCVKVYRADDPEQKKTVLFTIDNTAPNITFTDTPYFVIVNASITIKATLVDGNLVKNYTIDFGDGNITEVDITDASSYSLSEPHIYNTSGQYTVTITARDKAENNVVKTNIVTVNAATPDWVIELSADEMNMFSIPLIPESTDIEDVLDEAVSDNAEKIWSYQKGEWKYNLPTSTGWSTTTSRLQEIVPGYGYIIFMDNDAVVYGSGKELGADVPPEVTLTTGWNLIGHYGLDGVNVDTSNAFESLELGDNDYWYNLLDLNDDGNFEIRTDPLQPTEAYWLSIKSLNLEENELRYFTYFPCTEAY